MTVKRLGTLLGTGPQVPAKRTNPTYGRVFFELRERFDLTASECLLADVIDTLSRRTGWCFASREYLADLLGVSLRGVKRFLKRLREKGLVENKPGSQRQIRTTALWQQARMALQPGQLGTDIIKG